MTDVVGGAVALEEQRDELEREAWADPEGLAEEPPGCPGACGWETGCEGVGDDGEPEAWRDQGEPADATDAGGAGPDEGPRVPVTELTPRELGAWGEQMAASYLERRGWCLLERNWRCRYVVLVEVKTRLALGEGLGVAPEGAVDGAKKRRYKLMGLTYLSQHPETCLVRIDVVAITVVGDGDAKLRHVFGAVAMDE